MYRVLFFVFVIVGLNHGEVIDNVVCNKGRDSRNIKSEVHEIRVIPCAEAETGEPCKLYRGSNATIEVDFTPTRNSRRRMKNALVWVSKVELPFRGFNQNACKFMSCPLKADNSTTYSATIPLGKHLPVGTYPVKLKIYDGAITYVCQLFSIKLEDEPEEIDE